MGNERVNILYKFYNKDKELLYVGITNSPDKRFYIHSMDKEWFSEVYAVMCSKEMTRNEIRIYEIYTIAKEKPKYNIDFADGGEVLFDLPILTFKEYTEFTIHHKKNIVEKFIRLYLNGKNYEYIAEKTGQTIDYVKESIDKAYEDERSKLNDYIRNKINKKIFNEDRQEITKFLSNLCILGHGINYRSNSLKPSTIQNIIDKCGLDYIITKSKRETSNKLNKMNMRYIIIKNKLKEND